MYKLPARILITGSNGFIGRNVVLRLSEFPDVILLKFTRSDDTQKLISCVSNSDAIIHLAGNIRPADLADYDININLTKSICDAIKKTGRQIPIIFASSSQVSVDNAYGRSKLAAESFLLKFSKENNNPVAIFRMPGVFGKWCRPNYNSVVATYCYNLSRGLPITITDPNHELKLIYVDDLVTSFVNFLTSKSMGIKFCDVDPVYNIKLQDLADTIQSFVDNRSNQYVGHVGSGLMRALYATYISYLPCDQIVSNIGSVTDSRGVFVEILKTSDSGQFSFFTALPGVTRGGHYHHTKTEKFLVIRGAALFRFRDMSTNEYIEIRTSENSFQIVDTIPGWAHEITNVGDVEMLVMLWSNEIFNPKIPDTISCKI